MGLNGDSSSFQCSGQIIVSDPCYDLPASRQCGPHVFTAVQGQWKADVDFTDHNDVSELRAYAVGHYSDAQDWVGRVVAVDSGQAGVFDAAWYRGGDTNEAEDWYDRVCNGMENVNGVCTSSFGGDGTFDLYVDYTDGATVSAVRIVFHEEEEEDEEDDY